MNCADVRDHLPELAYDALRPDDQTRIAAHLHGCPDCRRELEELRQVRGLLDATPAPTVRVDVSAVYRAAAAEDARRTRRWRRLALAACAATAASLLVLVSRLEFRAEAHQFVVRWKTPPALETPTPPAPSAPVVVVQQAPPPTTPSPQEWQDVNSLLQALVEDARMRDVQYQQDITRMRAQIAELRRQNARRVAAVDNELPVPFVAHFSDPKGDHP